MNSDIHFSNPITQSNTQNEERKSMGRDKDKTHITKENGFMPTPIGVIFEETSLIGSCHDERYTYIYIYIYYIHIVLWNLFL